MSHGSFVRRWAAAGLGVLIGAFIVGTQFPAAGNDDSHITYWVAHTLAARGAVENYDGYPVEQTSSLSFAFVLSLAARAGLSIPVTAWVLGMACAALSVVLVSVPAREGRGASTWAAPMLLDGFLPFLYWSTSGMEGTFVAALGLAVAFGTGELIDTERRPTPIRLATLGVAAVAFALGRPEAPLELVAMTGVAAALVAWRAFSAGGAEGFRRVRRAAVALGASVVLGLAIAAARWFAFGVPIPNSAAAKTHAFALAPGAGYLLEGLSLSNPLFGVAILAGLVVSVQHLLAGRAATWLALLVGWCVSAVAFVVASGGDWMPCVRLLVPIAPGLALVSGQALDALERRSRWLAHGAGAGLVLHGVVLSVEFGSSPLNGSYRGAAARVAAGSISGAEAYSFSELANRAHRRDARLLGALMPILRHARPSPEHPVTLMSGQAGMVPYYVFRELQGSARFIDLYALTDPRPLACLPPKARAFQRQGVQLSPGYIIDHADELGDCDISRPDVVYSTGRFPAYLRERGYRRVYQGPRDMEAFIAVSEDLLAEGAAR